MKFTDFLPYIVSVLTAIISGVCSYFGARKQAKEDIARLKKQHELDIEKEREKFAMEKEKLELEHKHQIELMQKEAENKMGGEIMNALFSEVMKTPEVKQQIVEGMRKGNKKS